MFPRIILSLVETAAVPVLLIFGVKFLALILIAGFAGIPFELSLSGFDFPDRVGFSWANAASNVVLLIFTFLVLYLTLLRLYFLAENHLRPEFSARLVNAYLEGLVVNTRQAYLQAVVWFVLALGVTLSLLAQSLLGFSPFSLGIFALLLFVSGIPLLGLSLGRDLPRGSWETTSVTIIGEGFDD